jgi:pyrimidine-specific ribonucleoside hydrolase
MKRKIVVILISLVVFLIILVCAGGPLLVKLGIRPFSIQTDNQGGIRLVRLEFTPTPQPALQPGIPPLLAADAQPVVIDTDMAPDDWLAILYLLQRPDVAVKAITVSGTGEAHCDPGVRNAMNLVMLAGRPEIPIACGRETPLQGSHTFPKDWRESVDDMLGLVLLENPNPPANTSAVALLTHTAQNSSTPIKLLALGPLTNVAEALESDPAFAQKLHSLTIMGGAVDVPGNVGSSSDIKNVVAEWNIYIDPHAAAVVFKSGVPITLVPLDATDYVTVTTDFYQRQMKERLTPSAEFVYRVFMKKDPWIRVGDFHFWDPLAAALLTDESQASYQELSLAVVEEEGPASGQTVVSAEGQPMRVAIQAELPRFEKLFRDTINGKLK